MTPGRGYAVAVAPAADPTMVSILTPVLDEERHIEAAIAGMQGQRFEGSLEFLIIDGASSDRTREVVAELALEDSRIRLLDNPRQITPVALNIGLRCARGAFVARMDAHTGYRPDYVQRGVDRLRAGDVSWVSGPQRARGVGPVSRAVTVALESPLGTGGAAFRRSLDEEVDVDSGFTGVWRRETLEAAGGWDEGWAINQDAELAARIVRGGGRIVCLPEMEAEYIPRDSLGRLARQYRRYGFYRAKTISRHREGFRRSHLLPPGLVLTLAATVLAPLRPVRRAAAGGAAAYAALIAREGGRTAARTGRRRDAVAVPVVLVTMHLTWGAGFLAGALRFLAPMAVRKGAGRAEARPPRAPRRATEQGPPGPPPVVADPTG